MMAARFLVDPFSEASSQESLQYLRDYNFRMHILDCYFPPPYFLWTEKLFSG